MSGHSVEGQDRIMELFLSFWAARALMAAVELDLFDLLGSDGLTLDDVRAHLALADRPARGLLDTCVAAGLVERDGERYRSSPDAMLYLSRDSEYSVRNYILDERWCWSGWGDLVGAMRANAPTLTQDDTGYRVASEDFLLDFLHGHTLVMAERLAEVVDFSTMSNIMDVGGGSGAASISLARAYPKLHTAVVDLPEVCARTDQHIANAGLSDRIRTHPANVFTDALPGGCDGAIICNLLHDFSVEKARAILGRVAEALPSGAKLVLMEMAPNDDRSAPLIPVAFSLTMLVNTEGGDSYTVPQYSAWLHEAGFDVERVAPLGGRIVTTAIEAVKR
jgi:3-hydroxy-5-methyl-1-naphthoate 3-O-methyltransferase